VAHGEVEELAADAGLAASGATVPFSLIGGFPIKALVDAPGATVMSAGLVPSAALVLRAQ
jgi:hypothetical protein